MESPFEQLRRWWIGNDSPPSGWEDDAFLDEVAYGLCQHGPAGIALVKQGINSPDVERRCAALFFLAAPESVDEDVRAALRRGFAAPNHLLKTAALWGFMDLSWFPLERKEVEGLTQDKNPRLAALAMCYLSRAFPAEVVSILTGALHSDNPRMREYACDEIGDRGIVELSGELRRLLNDSDEAVAEAARSNLDFFC